MKKVTIRRALYISFSIVVLVSFMTITMIFGFFEMPKMKVQTISVLEQNCLSIAQAVDREMEQVRGVAMNVAHSSLIRDKLLREEEAKGTLLTATEAETLQFLLSSVILPNDDLDQVRMYLPNGEIVGTGRVNDVWKGLAEDEVWYSRLVGSSPHNAFVYIGEDEALGKYTTGFYNKRFVSYVMEQFDNLNLSNGYIEVSRSIEEVLSAAIQYTAIYNEQVYVVDGHGNLIFPENGQIPRPLKEKFTGELPEESGLYISDNYHVFYSPSEYSDFCTVLIVQSTDLLSPVFDYVGKIALIAFFTLVCILVISYFFSRRISLPIQQMCEEVTSFDLTDPQPTKGLQTNVEELSTLYSTFSQMREKLIDSMNTQLLLQNQEMQARMLALQTQMNPHFLYNSLATIQAMADENMNEEIVEMCAAMSDILRYISSDAGQEVPLVEEIRHTNNYLRCMAIRFQGELTYQVEIPEQMYQMKVPKLCVQLLVENAIKFTATGLPPYRIDIVARQYEDRYELSVMDNGPGFARSALETLGQKIAQIDESGLLPSLEINGMGLMNIYIRYKLLYQDRAIFRLENRQDRGACVTIGEYYG